MPTQHHFLPKLDDAQADVPMPPMVARWEAQPASLLQSVGSGIAIDGTARTRGISSVPDVWARAILFQTALKDPRHPMHARALADWRGLLSLLALREVYSYPVEVVPVDLGGGGKLSEALRTLAPPPVEVEQGTPYAWADVLLIRLDGVPVGAFSPGTLVYTATGYQDRLRAFYEPPGGEPRKRPGCLGPDYSLVAPTRDSDASSAHFVAEYVHDLYENIKGRLGRDAQAQMLSELLRTWTEEARSAFGYSPQAPVDAPEVMVAPALPTNGSAAEWPRLAAYRVYEQALRPIVEDPTYATDIKGKSTIFLQHRRNHTDRAGVVVIHKDTLRRTERIWGLRRLDSLGESAQEALDAHFNAPSGTTIAGDDLDYIGAAWIRPERFFLTDVLLKPRQGTQALTAAEQAANAGGEYILPFRKEILDFFGPDEVLDVLKPRFERVRGGETVKFAFDLPVGSHPGLLSAANQGDGYGSAPAPTPPSGGGEGGTTPSGFGAAPTG
ncbi:MAG: hypothetical protein AAFN13_05655, partial [Bacteroidota bacterium]